MFERKPVRDVTVFVSLYLMISLPPFLFLYDIPRELIGVAAVATVGTVLLLGATGAFLASEGVDRFTQFLFAPTDVLSVVVDLVFVLAAAAWWFVPQLVFYFEWEVTLEILFALILIAHIPMVLLLSLMNTIGKAQSL
ncbi:MAG: hypothetical protein ACI8XM_002536 [Haloarculaceae archaeon]|jgi:hypothetical protein